ncbi:hypothetical protein CTA1_8686 [Colletotrichum tanaceti]|uniref:Uncharacterized protein n=1 Tax=Colletotrichum tanaceti TaxID=1306861 RepID=A0A4U6XSI6_9PEZI|nr:hypothetical protein CTA1_8686 [Colletotrichum tanaceti]
MVLVKPGLNSFSKCAFLGRFSTASSSISSRLARRWVVMLCDY